MQQSHGPYGVNALEPKLSRCKRSGKFRCPVRACRHWLKPPTRKPKFAGEVCPDHGIMVHGSRTYTYADYQRNLLVDADYFDAHIRRHPFKYEAHRFGAECSEDALSWNVFRSLQQGRCLRPVVELCIGHRPAVEPRLFLWGIEIGGRRVEPWNLLIAARERFESDLPVARPKTEPDIALYQPGQYLVLIEAKFTSPNPVYEKDRRKLLDLTLDQLLTIYRWPGMRFLDLCEAHRRQSIHYQLWRNLVFAEWMAARDGAHTRGYVVNLVRAGHEGGACESVLGLLDTGHRDRFEQITWEQLHAIARAGGLDRLCRYMAHKSARLRQAFAISTPPAPP